MRQISRYCYKLTLRVMPLSFIESHEPLVLQEMKPDCFVCVVVPVRNEAENIRHALAALTNQVDLNNRPLNPNSFEVIILANNCDDDSAAITKSWQKKHPALNFHLYEAKLPAKKSNVGYVRRWLMNEAYLRLRGNKFGGGVIMTTDGDTCAAPNWIAANLKEIETGADAVGGRILINPADLRRMNEKARRFHLLDTGYRLLAAEIEARLDFVAHDPLPRHHQHFNGSFAVTTEAFQRAGGVPSVRFLEDVAFFQSLLRIDARVRHSPLARVQTSSRSAGRTELGLSTQIIEWTLMGENGDSYYVESAAAIAERINLRRRLREIWRNSPRNDQPLNRIADDLLISEDFLKNELSIKQTFGSLLEKVQHAQRKNGEWAKKHPLVCVSRAIGDLRQLNALLRRQNQTVAPPLAFSQTSSR